MDRYPKTDLSRRHVTLSALAFLPALSLSLTGTAEAQTTTSDTRTLPMTMKNEIFLFTLRGDLKPETWEDSRTTHNMTAGDPEGVAAARALGDLSHNVYVPLGDVGDDAATELLIMDLWNSLEGFQKFFSDPQVQAGGSMNFDATPKRDLWTKPADFISFSLPIPAGKEPCCVGLVRGTARSREAALSGFNTMASDTINAARLEGLISHDVYFAMPQPGQPETLEMLGVDVWMDAEGMGRFYSNPGHMAPLMDVFTAAPEASVWTRPAGEWVVW